MGGEGGPADRRDQGIAARAPRLNRALVVVALLVAVAALGGCLPAPVSDRGRSVSELYTWFTIAAAAVFALVAGLLGWSIIRYRGTPGRDAVLPRQSRGNVLLEVMWWAIPTALVAVLVVMTAGVLGQVDARAADPQVRVRVEGFQWGWRFTYPDAGVEVIGTAANPPTIQLPVGETIAFEVTSLDVVHSFSIPRFLIKRDAVPNRVNRFDVVIEEEGTYTGQCAEFCGLLHAAQLFAIEAVPPDAFEAWLADQQAAGGASPAAGEGDQ